jgi:drug/metabolite transporter (DMT)-like permease
VPPKPAKITYYLLIAAALQIVWGLVPTASKIVIDEIPIELYIAIRWSISGAIFAIYLTLTKGWQKIALRDAIAVSALGVCGYGLASITMLHGLKIGGVTNFALMGALSPAITSLLAIAILRERPSRLFYFALPLSVIGLLLLIGGKYQISSVEIAVSSAVLIVGGCVCEALVFIGSKKFKTRVSAVQYLAIAQLATAFAMWISQAAFFRQIEQLNRLTTDGILAAAFVSIVACVLCYVILYWLLNFIDGHRLALFDGFHTLSATTFGYLYFSEPVRPLTWIGGSMIVAGLVLGNLPARKRT